MSKTLYALLILSSAHLCSCAQSKLGVRNMQGFVVTRVAGNIPVDANGEPLHIGVDSAYIIYVEVNKKITWDSAWIDGKRYPVIADEVTEFPFRAGQKRDDGEELLLTPKKGYSLWMLQLDKNLPPVQAEPPGNNRLHIRGWQDNKYFIKELDKFQVLNQTNSV